MVRSILAASLALSFGSTALAAGESLIVATQDGLIYEVDPVTGESSLFSITCGNATGAAIVGRTLLIGDANGIILTYDAVAELPLGGTFIGEPITDMAVHGGDVLVSTAERKIYRLDPVTLAIEDTFVHFDDIEALVQDGAKTIFGNLSTMVYKGDIDSGDVDFLTACGGQVTSAALEGSAVLLGTVQGRVYSLNKEDGAYYNIFQFGSAQTALAALGGVFFTADAAGGIRRVDAATGQVLASFDIDSPIGAMVVAVLPCMADFNADGRTNVFDFLAFQNAWTLEDPAADLDHSGSFTVFDFLVFQDIFAEGCE